MLNGMFIEAHIADLHFGAMEPNEQYKILKEQFLDKLCEMPILDIVSICGDIFHHKFMANSNVVYIASYFITQLISICEQKNTTLLILSGTYSHDADQIKLFYPLAEQVKGRVDVRIIEEARFEYVKGKKILCIPELYGKGKTYYENLLFGQGPYDMCIMHGTYVNSVYGKIVPNLDAEREPIFCMNDFNLCLGPIISGHIHQPQCYDKHFYYCGSPYRWQFGDEPTKGFIWLLQDTISHTYVVKYEEIISDKYITLNLDDLIDNKPEDTISFINNYREKENIKYIRVVFTKSNLANINVIDTYFRNNKFVDIVNNSKNDNVVKTIDEVQEKYNEFEYIYDNNMTAEEKLVRYINDCKGYVMFTTEDLVNILKDL